MSKVSDRLRELADTLKRRGVYGVAWDMDALADELDATPEPTDDELLRLAKLAWPDDGDVHVATFDTGVEVGERDHAPDVSIFNHPRARAMLRAALKVGVGEE